MWKVWLIALVAIAALVIGAIALSKSLKNSKHKCKCSKSSSSSASSSSSSSTVPPQTQTNLVSDIDGVADLTDPNLINSWGVVVIGDPEFWVADNGSGLLTQYTATGPTSTPVAGTVVTVPLPATGAGPVATPSGLVLNSSGQGFIVETGGHTGSALLITVTEDGTISGYNPTVALNDTITEVDGSASFKVFKGAALLGGQLYVANFRSGFVEVYDSTWTFLSEFTDPALTLIGYAPFNCAAINGQLYVSFAKQDLEEHNDVAGTGNGFVDIFAADGTMLKRFINRGPLNSPWAMLVHPQHDQVLMVGNFGDGKINLFDLTSGTFLKPLTDCNGNPISIDSLWGITPFSQNALLFAAGINSENDGLVGSLSNC